MFPGGPLDHREYRSGYEKWIIQRNLPSPNKS